MRALGRHDTGQPRRAQDIAFFGIAIADDSERLRGHAHMPCGHRLAFGQGLVADIHHMRRACLVEMT